MQLRKEHAEIIRLVNLTRPANLPPLIPQDSKPQLSNNSSKITQKKTLPIFGKRLKVKVMLPSREFPCTSTSTQDSEEDENEEMGENNIKLRSNKTDSKIKTVGVDSKEQDLNLPKENSTNISRKDKELPTSSQMQHSSQTPAHSSQMQVDSSHTQVDSSDLVVDLSHSQVDSSHTQANSSHSQVDSSQMQVDSTDTQVDSSHTRIDSSHMQVDSSHRQVDLSSSQVDSSHMQVDSSDLIVDSSDSQVDSSDAHVDSSDTQVDSFHTPADSSQHPRNIERIKLKNLQCDPTALASLDNKVKAKISKTVVKLRKLAEEEESIVVDEKCLAVKKKKILDQVNRPSEHKDMDRKIKQLSTITSEYCDIGDRKLRMVNKINKLAEDINKIAKEIRLASKLQREQAINRMKTFVEKAHKQQVEIYKELNKLEKSTTDQKVLEKLKTLHSWLTNQKSTMLENLEKLKTTQMSENSQLFDEIMRFEENADRFIITILEEIRRMQEETTKSYNLSSISCVDLQEASGSNKNENEEGVMKDEATKDSKKSKNLRRIIQRQEKAELEKQKLYEEDAMKEDYDMWVPPDNQIGDGRTSLNDKFGY